MYGEVLALYTKLVFLLMLLMMMLGQRKGKSLLIEDGALPWVVANVSTEASSVRRHIELALCHLAQHGVYVITYFMCKYPR